MGNLESNTARAQSHLNMVSGRQDNTYDFNPIAEGDKDTESSIERTN